MKKKEFELREKGKADIIVLLVKLNAAAAELSAKIYNENASVLFSTITGNEILDNFLDGNPLREIIKKTKEAFQMDAIINSPESIRLLREMATEYSEKVKKMDLDEMLNCDDSGYCYLRQIYERKENFIYPTINLKRDSKEYKERANLYRELSHVAHEIFKAALEKYYKVESLSQKAKDKLYNKAYSDGHSSGFNEIRYHYSELVMFYEDMIK